MGKVLRGRKGDQDLGKLYWDQCGVAIEPARYVFTARGSARLEKKGEGISISLGGKLEGRGNTKKRN